MGWGDPTNTPPVACSSFPLTDRGCDTTDAKDGVCNTTGSALGSCADFETSNLTGLRLAGGIPFTDSAGLGDGAFSFRYVCE